MRLHKRAADQRGSALMLMPAAILVVMVLGAIAVDSTLAFLAERELANAAAAAANDAAGEALDVPAFYNDLGYRLDPARVQRVVDLVTATRNFDYLTGASCTPSLPDGVTVTVTCTAQAPLLFAKAIPGTPDNLTVDAVASATAVQNP